MVAHPKPEDSKAQKDLQVVTVDVEGGAAVLFVTPEGKSLLIDSGWAPGIGGPRPVPGSPPPPAMPSSADRIAAAAASLGVTKIDYLLITHYHADHVGGLESLLTKLPVGTFLDHGPNREPPPPNATPHQLTFAATTLYSQWTAAYQGHEHMTAQVGQTLNIGSMHLQFVTSDGNVLLAPLPGGGQTNPSCAGVPTMDRNGGEENVRSLGMLITFGRARILYLGDLSWNKEMELLCPINKLAYGQNIQRHRPWRVFMMDLADEGYQMGAAPGLRHGSGQSGTAAAKRVSNHGEPDPESPSWAPLPPLR
jgi:competence protein ComEC